MSSTDKYDRQLRLWGSHGQRALMSASILLLNADGLGAETLKNLVLPGLGCFTIVDDTIVSESDFGVNFFVEKSWLGRPRSEVSSNEINIGGCSFLRRWFV
jgi:NEDD8-activating enzyme E1 regulatory subunit